MLSSKNAIRKSGADTNLTSKLPSVLNNSLKFSWGIKTTVIGQWSISTAPPPLSLAVKEHGAPQVRFIVMRHVYATYSMKCMSM